MHTTARTEDLATYGISLPAFQDEDDLIIARARQILAARLNRGTDVLSAPDTVRSYLALNLAELPHEVFGVIWLTAQHQVLADDQLFRGTITQTSVYPREVVKSALAHNAAAAILYHNHPSGSAKPSIADESLTRQLKDALALVDVKVLDHFIVAGAARPTSFAERGLL